MKPSEKPIDRIDQFFKNKLDDHTIAPPENAWPKVEAGLSKKNNVVLWRWAAAVLLMGALISIIYKSQTTTEKVLPVLAEKNLPASKIEIEKEKSSASAEIKISKADKAVRTRTNEKYQKLNNTVDQKNSTANVVQKHETIAVVDRAEKKMGDEKIEEKIKVNATPSKEVASTQQKPIKLEFTLEDLPSVETVATTNEVKNSGLKKVLNLARDMKQGKGPLTNLREKKNELFAHNFITGKERTQ